MNIRILRFLNPERAADDDRVLVVQSGAPGDAVRLVEALRERWPRSTVTLLVRCGAESALPPLPDVEVIPNQAANAAWIRQLQARRFDRVYVLLTGDSVPWKLKLLPFVLGANAVYAVNENLDWFVVSARDLRPLAHHLRWRLESSLTYAGERRSAVIDAALKGIAYPAVLAYLVLFERRRDAQARALGAPDWKRSSGPEAPAGSARRLERARRATPVRAGAKTPR